MAEPIGKLELKLQADITQLESDLKKAEGRANTAGKRIARNMQGAFKGVGAIRVKLGLMVFALAQIAALGGMKRLVDGAIDAADAIGKTSDKLGISNSALQEFQYAAAQSGVKLETLNMGLQRFGRRAAEAATGTGEARGALKRLKIELTDGQGALRSTEALFMDTMKALSEIENPLERVRLGFKLFDSEGVALVNMAGKMGVLRDEAQKMGLILDDEVIAKAEETKDTLSALAKITSAQLTPALADLGGGALIAVGEQLAVVAFWANKMYRSLAATANLGLSNTKMRLIEARDELLITNLILKELEDEFARSGDPRGATKHLGLDNRRKYLNAEIIRLEKQKINLENARKKEANILSSGPPVFDANAEEKAADMRRKIAEKAFEDLRAMRATDIKNIQHEANKKIAKLEKATKDELKIYGGKAEAIEAIRDAAAIKIDAVNAESHEKMIKQLQKDVDLEARRAEKIKKMRDGVHQKFLEATKTEEEMIKINLAKEIEELKRNIDKKLYLHAQFLEDKEELERVAEEEIKDLRRDNIDLEKRYLEEREKAFEESFGFIRDGFADAMTEMILTGEASFKTLADSFLREFVQRAIGSLAGTAFTALSLAFSPTPIGPLQADGTFNGIGLAHGGPIGSSRGPTLVGEMGPELFLPHTSGFIANNQTLSKMGGGGGSSVSVTVINNTGQESSTTEQNGPSGRSIEVMIGKAISKNISRGGDVDQAIRNSYGVNRIGRHGI